MPLVLCEFRGETTGDGEDIEERELPSELHTLALSVVESDGRSLVSELKPVEVVDIGVECLMLLLSPWKGAGEGVELCSDDVPDSLVEPYDADGNILAILIALGLKG